MPAEGKGKKMKKYAPSLTMWLIFENALKL